MIKQIFIPVTMSYPRQLAMMAHTGHKTAKEDLEALRNEHKAAVHMAEAELDDALYQGYSVISSHVIEINDRMHVHYVLYLYDDGENVSEPDEIPNEAMNLFNPDPELPF